jgi:hypothetical protein
MKYYDAETNAVVELYSTDGARTLQVAYPHGVAYDLRDIEFIFCDSFLTVSGYINTDTPHFYEHKSFDLRTYS